MAVKVPDTRRKRSGRVSSLRTIYNDLRRLSKKAIKNVEDSVNGDIKIDSQVLLSSKWVVDRLNVYSKAVIYEEQYLNGKLKEAQANEESSKDDYNAEEDGRVVRFSLGKD